MELIEPNINYLISFRKYMNEYEVLNDDFYLDIYDEAFGNFKKYLKLLENHSEGRRLPRGWTAYKTYWLIDYNEVIGVIRIRYKSNKVIGNIGYDIRPSKRYEGYGTKILKLGLIKARDDLKMKRINISCKTDNLASKKIIEYNGGQFINIVKSSDGEDFYMYIIRLDKLL